jgi:hypothetical protein
MEAINLNVFNFLEKLIVFSWLKLLLLCTQLLCISLTCSYCQCKKPVNTSTGQMFNSQVRWDMTAKVRIVERVEAAIDRHSSNWADKASCDFAASTVSAYRQTTRKHTILDQKYEIPGLDRLLKNKRKLRKLWQEPGIHHAKWQKTGSLKISGEWCGKEHLKDRKQSWQTTKSHLKQ